MERTIMDHLADHSCPYPEVTDDLLAHIVRRIRSAGDPIKILLFGSRARGDERPNSDLDILVVEGPEINESTQTRKYMAALREISIPHDVLVTNLRQVAEWRSVPNSMLSQIITEGRILYQAGYEREQTAEALLVQEGLTPRTRLDLTRSWLQQGDADLTNALQLLAGPGPFRVACYLGQQAIEKYLKGFLAFHGRPVPHEHDLENILRRCEEIELLPEIADLDLRTITDYMLMGRYAPDFWPERDIAAAAASAAETTRQQVRSILPPEAQPDP